MHSLEDHDLLDRAPRLLLRSTPLGLLVLGERDPRPRELTGVAAAVVLLLDRPLEVGAVVDRLTDDTTSDNEVTRSVATLLDAGILRFADPGLVADPPHPGR